VRVALAVGSLVALMILFFSLQESDVSTKNGIARRRLPPGVIGQVGASTDQPLSKYATREWLESQDRYRDDRPRKDDDKNPSEGPSDAVEEYDDYEYGIGESEPGASPPPSSGKQTGDATKDKDEKKDKVKKVDKKADKKADRGDRGGDVRRQPGTARRVCQGPRSVYHAIPAPTGRFRRHG